MPKKFELKLSPEDISNICQLRIQGVKLKDLCDQFDISMTTLRRYLKNSGVMPRKSHRLSQSDIEVIRELRDSGLDLPEIASHVECSLATVSSWLSKLNLSYHKKLSEEEVFEICGQFNGFNTSYLSKKYGVSLVSINNVLRKNGFPALSQSELQRKYPINEDFFDVIDSQEKAYTLGLLYADGCNHSTDNGVSISLHEKDRHILEKMRDLIQPTKPLYLQSYEDSNWGTQYKFQFKSQHMSDRLTELGCVPRKSHILKFPTEEQVPNHLLRHFIRGYFDGDGCITRSGCGQPQISMIGNIDFIEPLQKYLMKELGFRKTKLVCRWPDASPNIVSVKYGGNNQCGKFCDWLYENSIIHFDRKYAKFD